MRRTGSGWGGSPLYPCSFVCAPRRAGGGAGKALKLSVGDQGGRLPYQPASATLQRKVFGVPGRAPYHLCFCAAPVAEYHVRMQINTKSVQLKLISSFILAWGFQETPCVLRSVLENEVAPEVELAGHLGLGWLFVVPKPIRRRCSFLR